MKIIFLHPVESEGQVSGSALRPRMMLKAFHSKDYEVFEITGNKEKRRERFDLLLKALDEGQKFDYLYVESLSRPTNSRISKVLGLKVLVTEKLEYEIIKACIGRDVPVGFFLRDLYWDFAKHFQDFSWVKRIYLKTALSYFGRRELKFLRRKPIQVLTPSVAFSAYLKSKWKLSSTPLPPGADVKISKLRTLDEKPLKLFYVGGVSGLYNPTVFLKGLTSARGFNCTICTRPAERKELQAFESEPGFQIIEGSGGDLIPRFEESHIALYPLPPKGYIRLAHGVKISEYIANGLPIIAFEGTNVAELITRNDIGWVIPFESNAVAPLIDDINAHPESYCEKQSNVIRMQKEIGWEQVVDRLERKLSIE